jgi:antitoxin ParD1/3/4
LSTHYRVAHHCKTRSQVFEEARELLRARELEQAYRDADREADTTPWDEVTADGLADETW